MMTPEQRNVAMDRYEKLKAEIVELELELEDAWLEDLEPEELEHLQDCLSETEIEFAEVENLFPECRKETK